MSATLQPTGLRPVGIVGNGPYVGAFSTYPLTTNNTAAIAVGDLVALVAGSVVAVAAAAASGTLSANTPLGVVQGFEYQDPITPGRALVEAQLLPANSVTAGYKSIKVKVFDAPDMRFSIQANGTVAAAALGATINPANFGQTDLVLKTSRLYADTATLDQTSGSTKMFKIVGFDRNEDNAAGDAYTKLIVKFNSGVHYYGVAGAH